MAMLNVSGNRVAGKPHVVTRRLDWRRAMLLEVQQMLAWVQACGATLDAQWGWVPEADEEAEPRADLPATAPATPTLARWRAELAAGTRTATTFDGLWLAACREQRAVEAHWDGLHNWAAVCLRAADAALRDGKRRS